MRLARVTAAAVALGSVCPASAETRVVVAAPQRMLPLSFSVLDGVERVPVVRLPDEAPAGPARETQAVRLGTPSSSARIGRVQLVIDTRATDPRAKLSFVLATPYQVGVEVVASLEVPRDARVVGLALTLGKGPRVAGSALQASDARTRYGELLHGRRDPALLEHDTTRQGTDRLLLHVFPVTDKQAATVELEMVLPPSSALTIDSSQRIDALAVVVDGKASPSTRFDDARRIELPAPRGSTHGTERVLGAAVDERTSLYVGQPPGAPPLIRPIVISCGVGVAHETVSVGSKTIRREVRRHLDQLRYCYSRELQQRPSLAGRVELHFLIGTSGAIDEASVDGDLDSEEVKQCMREQVVQWRFHEQDSMVRVNYPLTLVNPY